MLAYYWMSLYFTGVYNSDKITTEEITKETQVVLNLNHKATVQDLEVCIKKLGHVIYNLNILKEINWYLVKNISQLKRGFELTFPSRYIFNHYKQEFHEICDALIDNLKYIGLVLVNKNLRVYFDLNLLGPHLDLIISTIKNLKKVKILFYSLYAKNIEGKFLSILTDENLCVEELKLEEVINRLTSYLDDCVTDPYIYNELDIVFNGLIVMLD